MIELLFSFLITVVPDYLYRRNKQGKRLGHEITLYNVWYELRWGITSCAVLAITLITVIFYFHPTTSNVTSLFRTVSIISDMPGRVAEVYVQNNHDVRAGDALFRLDTRRQEAAVETAQRQIDEIEAALVLAESELAAAEGVVQSVTALLQQAEEDLTRILNARRTSPGAATAQQEDAQRAQVEARRGELRAAEAQRTMVQTRKDKLLPAQRATALAALAQTQTEIAKSTVYAGVDGNVQQFKLKPGDIVNPILRPAGILVPHASGVGRFQAGFGQISAQVVKVGMITEITCASKPLTVIPMMVTEVQSAIAGGQLRPTDQLIDIQDRQRPGTIMATLEPIYSSHADAIPPGSVCAAVAYTSRAAERDSGELTGLAAFVSSIVDGMGIANALVIRGQALLLPILVLVFG
jgi:multidrug resistance efflux pump